MHRAVISRVAAQFHYLPNLKPRIGPCDYLSKYHRSFSLHYHPI
jgi:hypothetical protein